MNKVFYLGQIRKEHRGDLTAVITDEDGTLGTLIYSTFSEETTHATGVRAVQHPPLRVYIGISFETGGEIASRTCGKKADGFDFRHTLDSLVVHSYFLRK